MRAIATRVLVVVVVAATLGLAVHLLREATQSTHYRTSPDSRLRVVVESQSNRAEPTQTLAELTEAHLSMCRLEVAADIEGEQLMHHLEAADEESDREPALV